MLKVTATNLYGQSLQVTQNSSFRTLVAGLNPPTGSVFTMELATKDGSLFNAGKVNERFITLTVYPQGDVEAARHELYKVFKVSKAVSLAIESGSRKCTILGYVEDFPAEFDTPAQSLQISIKCPDPFFRALSDVSASVPTAGTAVTVANTGDVETGAEFAVTATGAVEAVTIINATTGESFTANVSMVSGDVLKLTTVRGHLGLTLTHDGTTTNILNLMESGSDWITLWPGNNSIAFAATSGGANASMAVTFTPLYGGL